MSLTADAVIAKYIALRDKRSDLKKEYEKEDAKYRQAMELAEAWLMKRLDEVGADNLSVKGVGMAILGKDMKVSCKDWRVFNNWVRENDQLEMFERRISRNVLKSYLAEHEGEIPPALDVIFEKTVTVRRANKGD